MIAAFQTLDPQRQHMAYTKAAQRVKEVKMQAPAALEAIKLELKRRELRSYKKFVAHFWTVLEPDQALKWNWHLDIICDDVEKLVRGELHQHIENIPPGTMKSLAGTVFARAYIWSLDEGKSRFLAGSYGSHLSERDNDKVLKLVKSPEYQKLFPKVQLTKETVTRLDTSNGGWSIATSVGGVGTGEHPDYIFIDDPVTEAQARSKAERTEANTWIDRTLSTRGASRRARTLLIMQRFDANDPTGHLLKQGGWTHRCFPMEYIPSRPATPEDPGHTADPLDPRTVKGELLWPALLPQDVLATIYLRLGPFGRAGQMQQQPVPEGGGLFKREWFKFVSAAPVTARRVRGWDTAATEENQEDLGDYTASVRIAERGGQFFIEDATNERLSPAGVDALMLQTAHADGRAVSQRELREGGSAGKTVTSARTKLLVGFDHGEHRVTGDKPTEAKPYRAQVEAGNVYIVRTGDPIRDAWIEPFIRQHCDFPVGDYDDIVDGASCAFNTVLLEPVPSEILAW